MQRHIRALLIVTPLVCPACASEDELELRAGLGGSGGTTAGTVFNTNQIDDVYFSEMVVAPDEFMGDGVLKSVVLDDGRAIDQVQIDNGEVVAIDPLGAAWTGDELLGSRWTLGHNMWLSGKRSMRLSNRAVIDGTPHYTFEHQNDEGEWIGNCAGDTTQTKGPNARILSGFHLDGTSGELTPSDARIFIACLNAAVGKAAAWGYYDEEVGPPDDQDPPDVGDGPTFAARLDRFELAIRVVRADYCYDGSSWTEAGVALQVEDIWGIRPASAEPGEVEAVWGAEGLLCAGTGRYKPDIRELCEEDIPSCDDDATLSDYPGGLIMTRLPLSPEVAIKVWP